MQMRTKLLCRVSFGYSFIFCFNAFAQTGFWGKTTMPSQQFSEPNNNATMPSGGNIPAPYSKGALPDACTQFPARVVFLNGANINTVREQELENVNIRIDSIGNIYLTAPQYEVNHDTSYHPLLPNELPRIPKTSTQSPTLPGGKYSKGSGQTLENMETGTENQAQPTAQIPQAIPAPNKNDANKNEVDRNKSAVKPMPQSPQNNAPGRK